MQIHHMDKNYSLSYYRLMEKCAEGRINYPHEHNSLEVYETCIEFQIFPKLSLKDILSSFLTEVKKTDK